MNTTPETLMLESEPTTESGTAKVVVSRDWSGCEVWKYGGGTQSVAIAALIVQEKLPKPDLACIADTGRERSTTWQYMDSVVAPALRGVGVEIHRLDKAKYEYAHEDLYNRTGHLLIPAFTDANGKTGKMSGYCNKWWKRDVVDNWLRRDMGIKPQEVRSWIGFSADEYPRALRMMQGEEYKQGRIRFPLIELMLKRRDSIRLVEDMGWPTPPRSACWMCPNQTDYEWADLKKNHPDEFARAVAVENEMRTRDSNYWLHDSCQPLETVDFAREDYGSFLFRACDPVDGAACFT
jgi:hypothetical protein